MENQNDHKTIFRQWLEKLQQESWQLELLISGFISLFLRKNKPDDFDAA
ncbi:MAG: hypothetical protein IPN29_20040 [Saprospiraceae bacterium]|nr:hypothetical protein [Saprospiraceae bacterium]